MAVMNQIIRGILLTMLLSQNLTAVEDIADCEFVEDIVVHCSNFRSNNKDYFESMETLIPEYLDYATLTKGPDILLMISNSDLDQFPEDLLEGFNVTHLVLHNNYLAIFPAKFMTGITSDLVYLQLNDNDIDDLGWNDNVHHLPFVSNLETLILKSTQLVNFGNKAFSMFTNLQDIDLSDNYIVDVPPFAFANHYTLQNIDLSKNLLSTLDNKAFYRLPSLKTLDLSFNFIFLLEAWTFVELENLNHLNLLNNNILHVEETTFNERDMPKLIDLQIAGNPFVCDCNLQWLKIWLIEHSSLEESGATCEFPEIAEFGDIEFCPKYIMDMNSTTA